MKNILSYTHLIILKIKTYGESGAINIIVLYKKLSGKIEQAFYTDKLLIREQLRLKNKSD